MNVLKFLGLKLELGFGMRSLEVQGYYWMLYMLCVDTKKSLEIMPV